MESKEQFIKAYRFKGAGRGKESITDFTPMTWKNFTLKRPNGTFVFKDAANWRVLEAGVELVAEEPQEIILTAKDLLKEKNEISEEKKKLFNELIGNAERLLLEGKKEDAIVEYTKASEVFPNEKYPKTQVKKLNLELKTE